MSHVRSLLRGQPTPAPEQEFRLLINEAPPPDEPPPLDEQPPTYEHSPTYQYPSLNGLLKATGQQGSTETTYTYPYPPMPSAQALCLMPPEPTCNKHGTVNGCTCKCDLGYANDLTNLMLPVWCKTALTVDGVATGIVGATSVATGGRNIDIVKQGGVNFFPNGTEMDANGNAVFPSPSGITSLPGKLGLLNLISSKTGISVTALIIIICICLVVKTLRRKCGCCLKMCFCLLGIPFCCGGKSKKEKEREREKKEKKEREKAREKQRKEERDDDDDDDDDDDSDCKAGRKRKKDRSSSKSKGGSSRSSSRPDHGSAMMPPRHMMMAPGSHPLPSLAYPSPLVGYNDPYINIQMQSPGSRSMGGGVDEDAWHQPMPNRSFSMASPWQQPPGGGRRTSMGGMEMRPMSAGRNPPGWSMSMTGNAPGPMSQRMSMRSAHSMNQGAPAMGSGREGMGRSRSSMGSMHDSGRGMDPMHNGGGLHRSMSMVARHERRTSTASYAAPPGGQRAQPLRRAQSFRC